MAASSIYILWKWPPRSRKSYSENIARVRTARQVFGISFTVAALLYFAFLMGWIAPQFGVADIYLYLVSLWFLAQLVMVWVPARGPLAARVHMVAAQTVMWLMILSVPVILLTANVLLPKYKIVLGLMFFILSVLMPYLVMRVRRVRKNYLYYEIAFVIGFWVVMGMLAYGV
ncbi:MAG: hypothetical protein K0S68_1083 [Candidatus Saccharibacteria bacterium]|nr:hypothetical protein [Candidatus Saccharibacteria bacterium]